MAVVPAICVLSFPRKRESSSPCFRWLRLPGLLDCPVKPGNDGRRAGKLDPCRDARRIRAMGAARRKAQTYDVRVPFGIAAGAFRRAYMRSSSEAIARQKMREPSQSACSFAAFSLRRQAALSVCRLWPYRAQAGQRPVAQHDRAQAGQRPVAQHDRAQAGQRPVAQHDCAQAGQRPVAQRANDQPAPDRDP